jgi:hypothetical protein
MQRRQSSLAIAFDVMWRRQSAWDVPNPSTNLTQSFPATSRNYIDVDETTEDIEDCTGQDLLIELITGQVARLTIDFDCDPEVLAGILAFAYGAASAPSGGTNEVQTETVTATGGTRRIRVQTGANVQTTTPLAYNASAATILAALNALSNVDPGDIAVAQAAGPPIVNTFTFGGNLAHTDVELMGLDTVLLTGGSSTMAPTTPGVGAAHPITRTSTFSLPLLTLYVGFRDSDKDPVIFKNVVVNSVRVRASAREKVTVAVELIGSADLQPATGYVMPGCYDIVPVRFDDCALSIQGTDYIGNGLAREFEYSFANDIRLGKFAYTSAGINVSRLERDDKRPSYINAFIFGEPGDPLYLQATSRPNRTIVDEVLRIGPANRNVTCNVPQGIIKALNPHIRFEEGESQLNLQTRPKKVSGDATTPSNIVAYTALTTAYLVSA